MTRFIRYCIGIVICLFFVLPQLEAQQINYAEYFFDNDPGYGNGTSLTITQNNTIDANFSISTSSLSLGIHKLYVRTKSTTGEWSLCNYRLLYIRETASNSQIVAAEYFIDTDPGMGNATSVSLTAGDTITINQSISTASISPGIHYLYVRVKNAANRWSLIAPRLIYVIANQTTNLLVAAEYYFDNDPGHGNATSLAVTAGDTINVTSNISVASLSPGIHFLNVRARDASGKWSLSEQKMIFKSESITNGQISQAEYFYDNDPGLGNATSITITAGDTVNFTSLLSTTGLSAGIHNLNIRVKNGNGRWSLNSKRMIYVMAGNLSSPKITDAEYFFDTDPGFGNGTAFSITAGNTIDLTSVIASSSLSLGHHQLYVRAKDSLGRWSLNDKRLVYISPTLASQKISAIEYTVDTVMPMGQGNIINITPTDSLDHVFSFVHNLTDTFYHVLYARVKDVGGRWSLFDSTIFKLENCILPTANFTLSDICFGDTAVFVNTSTSTDTSSVFEWDIMNNGSVESNNADSMIYGFSSPGTYQVALKVTNFVCIDTVQKTIHVYPKPDTAISAFGPTSFCPGNFTVLSANTGIGYQYQWLKDGNSITNANGNFYQAQDSGAYSAAITNIYNCTSTTSAINVNVYDLPVATITNSGANSFCSGDSVILTANQFSGLTYQWYKNGDTIAGETNSTLTVKTTGNYKVKITNSYSCSDISSIISITVNPVPTANISAGGATTFCQGNNVLLYGSNGVGFSYQWYKDGNAINAANSSYYAANQSGDYRVLIGNLFQCIDTSTAINVTVNPVPVSTINLSGASIACQGDSVKLSGPSTSGLTYQWKSYGTNLQSANDSVYYVFQTGNYTLETTNSYNCSTVSSPQAITVNPVPGASILPLSSTSFCDGDSVILQGNVGIGLSYQWYKNSTLLAGETGTQYTAKTLGAYTVEVSNSSSCSSTSLTANVNVFAVPTSTFNLQSIACATDTVTITYNGTASAGAFYNWNFGGGIIVSGTAQGPYQVVWNNQGYKFVSLTVNENGCVSTTISDTIEIKSIVANITAPNTSVCDGDSVFLYANTGQNLTYQWYQGGLPVSGETNALMAATTSGNYTVLVTDSIVGCSQFSSNVQVNVYTNNFNLAFTATPTSFSQPPFNVVFTNSTPNMNNYLFLWEFGDGSTSSFYQPFHQYLFNGNYTVSLYAENTITGCHDTLVKSSYISCAGGAPNPCNIVAAISPAGPATICFNDSVMLTASSGTNYTYQWTFNGVILPGADSIVFYAKHNGTYRVIITDPLCSQTSPPFILNHYPSVLPIIQTNGAILPCTNDSMELYLGSFYNSYSWSTGKSSNSIWVSQTGYYTVTVTDNYGCVIPSPVYSVNTSFLQPPDICIVGVDTNNHNHIIWEKPTSVLIDSFFVYRESITAGQYDKIGTLPYSAPGIFSDTNSNPQVRAYRYKLAAKDTCGGQTLLSAFHKSIHLTINAGLNGAWNLIWDGYKGFPFGSYIIYRGTSTANMTLLTQLPSTLSSYTDLNPPTGTVYYQIEVLKTNGCYPDSIFSKVNTNYNSSRSNVANSQALVPVYLTADFGANIQNGVWPVQVEFTDATVGSPTSWKWSFGDGNSSITQNPKHTYNNTGIYTVSLIACNGNVCDTITKLDYINVLPNGIAEISKDVEIGIYPNPNDGMFTVDINSYQQNEFAISIYDLLGEKVYAEEIQSFKGNHKHNLNLSTLPKGIYNIVVMNDKFKRVGKVVIQ